MRTPTDGPPGRLSRLWHRFLDLRGWQQIAIFVLVIVVIGEIENLSRPKEAPNPHDVTMCSNLVRMNELAHRLSTDEAARTEGYRLLR